MEFGRHKSNVKFSGSHKLLNKIIISGNVFNTLVKNEIMAKKKSTSIFFETSNIILGKHSSRKLEKTTNCKEFRGHCNQLVHLSHKMVR